MNRAGEVVQAGNDEEQENEEVLTDEQLNEVIARNDEEYEIFTQMD